MKARSVLMLGCLSAVASLTTHCAPEKEVSIDYLGQKSPGMTAELFAPELISTERNEHSSLAFSPDGKTLLWAVMDSNYRGHLFEMTNDHGVWSGAAIPSFADTTTDDYAPTFSVDGKKLFFCSRRKPPIGYREGRGNRIWWVEKTADGWGTPVPLDTTVSKASEFSLSVSENGALYFSSSLGRSGPDLNIFKAEKTADGYAKPELLSAPINMPGYEDGPYISPDEEYLIFESTRAEGIAGSHDLYICFKHHGEWSEAINMGPKINSEAMERFPRVSPDGKYLFFASNRDQSGGKVGFDIYWIDTGAIDELRVNVKN